MSISKLDRARATASQVVASSFSLVWDRLMQLQSKADNQQVENYVLTQFANMEYHAQAAFL